MGIAGGLLLRLAEPTAEQIDLLGFAGELMLRLLKMLVLPLVAGSMVAGAPQSPPCLYICCKSASSAVQHKLTSASHSSLN